MAKSGLLNVVCHGTMALVLNDDGSIEVIMPQMDQTWMHTYQAGTWDPNGLVKLDVGSYTLGGKIKEGDGTQRFDENVNICWDGPWQTGQNARILRLPKPLYIESANYIGISPDDFVNPKNPNVPKAQSVAELHVFGYNCDDLESITLLDQNKQSLGWVPQIINDGIRDAVNLHVFAEPRTFNHRQAPNPDPDPNAPFNKLVSETTGKTDLFMKSDSQAGSMVIDFGQPIPGLPEPQKLGFSMLQGVALDQVMHDQTRPVNCSPVTIQLRKAFPLAQPKLFKMQTKVFARPSSPRVLSVPHVSVVYWHTLSVPAETQAVVAKMVNSGYICGALSEYGAGKPVIDGAFSYADGAVQNFDDTRGAPAKSTSSDIVAGLERLISGGALPDPCTNPDRLYLVVMPPGSSCSTKNLTGSHNYALCQSANRESMIHYAWVIQTEGNDIDGFTRRLSHEFLEACTNPEPPNGWTFDAKTEICDFVGDAHGTEDGIAMSAYYSHQDNAIKRPGDQATTPKQAAA